MDENKRDTLTGLSNRLDLQEAFSRAKAAVERKPASLAVLVLDIEHFKLVNDHYGHAVGDEVLVHVARTLLSFFSSAACVARVGGDEFVVLLLEADEAYAVQMAEQVRARLAGAPVSGAMPYRPCLQIGIAVVPAGAVWTEEELIRQADTALLMRTGKGGIHVSMPGPSSPPRAVLHTVGDRRLRNWRTFEALLVAGVRGAQRDRKPLALAIVDLWQFRRVNDIVGYRVGNELLARVSEALCQVVRDGDIVARRGGDEFGVLMPDTDVADATAVGEVLCETIAQDWPIAARPTEFPFAPSVLKLGASIGIAVGLQNWIWTYTELLRHADAQLLEAMSRGPDVVFVGSLGSRDARDT